VHRRSVARAEFLRPGPGDRGPLASRWGRSHSPDRVRRRFWTGLDYTV